MSQSDQLGYLFKNANKLHYEVDGQINEIYLGKEQTKDLTKTVVPQIKSKIDDL